MGTEIKTKMTGHIAKEFWGGDNRGVCLQVTASAPLRVRKTIGDQLQEEGFIQLTMEEAAALCNVLGGFIKREAKRRQALLKDEIAKGEDCGKDGVSRSRGTAIRFNGGAGTCGADGVAFLP